MNLIKIGNDGASEEIVSNLSKFSVTEKGRVPNYQVREKGLGGNDNQTIGELNISQIITEKSKEFFQRSEQNIFIGRDHSITLPILKSFVQFSQNPGVVIFDAHPDCSGVEDLVTGLINQNIIRKENIG